MNDTFVRKSVVNNNTTLSNKGKTKLWSFTCGMLYDTKNTPTGVPQGSIFWAFWFLMTLKLRDICSAHTANQTPKRV